MSSPGTTSGVTVQAEAAELVQAAPALVSALDEDLLGVIGQHVSDGLLCGKWQRRTTKGAVRQDGRFERSADSTTLWLREDGKAQYLKKSSWTSYKGAAEQGDEYGGGDSLESIEASVEGARGRLRSAGLHDTFITEPSSAADGTWELVNTDDRGQVLKLSGNGHFSAGAVEDDDLLYSGGGPKTGVTFEVALATLRSDYAFTPSHKCGTGEPEVPAVE